MPKVILDQAQAVAAVGEREAAECRSMCGCTGGNPARAAASAMR